MIPVCPLTKKGKARSLREKVERERAAMTPVEEEEDQPATATSTPKPEKKQVGR